MIGNMSKKLVFIIIAVVAALLVVGILIFVGDGNTPVGPDNPDGEVVEGDGGTASKLKVEPYEITNVTNKKDINVKIPKVVENSNYSFWESINREIAENVQDYLGEIDVIINREDTVLTLYKYTCKYDKYCTGDYLSILVYQDYQTGGIRSNSWIDVYNIDVKNCRKIYLEDIFASTEKYEAAIISEINKQATEKKYELVGGEGLTNLPTKQKFYIQDKKLVIYFDPAAIAPYVYGELRFEMPFELKDDGYFYID